MNLNQKDRRPVKSGRMRKLVAALLSVAISAGALAQVVYPTYQGTNQRQGSNLNTTTDNPGIAALNWFYPFLGAGTQSQILRTQNSSEASSVGTWLIPNPATVLASGYFVAISTGNLIADGLIGVNPVPQYLYSKVVPSSPGAGSTVGGATGVFTWRLTPGNTTPNDYALSVYLPSGPTTDAVSGVVFSQRYYVYQISYGTGQTYTDVVDRDFAGGGWVRLGNGGLPTNTLFHYDGVTPISIHLYNSIPRDSNGVLEGVSTDSLGNPTKPFLVYANAVEAVPNYGEVDAQPVIGVNTADLTAPARFIAAINNPVTVQANGTSHLEEKGTVVSLRYQHTGATGVSSQIWSFSPVTAAGNALILDAPSAAVTVDPTWVSVPTPGTGIYNQGANYFTTPVTAVAASKAQVTYSPTLANGDYDVYMWMPGVQAAGYAQNVQVEIDEGTTVNLYNVDLTQTNGYVRLGGRRFNHDSVNHLVVKITNLDTNLADAGKPAYADAVEFIGGANLAVTSTPVYATIPVNVPTGGGAFTKVTKDVVIVGAEDGRVYCLDATGRGDGTTDVYWAYPSVNQPGIAGYVDPNTQGPDGLNGVIDAAMPTGFSTSSPLVQEVPVGSGNFYLYIATTNGRVYCINTLGRGDGNLSTRTIGTTNRVWSYPNDFPVTPVASFLGSFKGSVVYYQNTAGPTIYVPTMQGRVYALDALGNANRTTNVRWAYPAINQPTIGPVAATPAIDGVTGTTPSVFFGTERPSVSGNGSFYSLNADTGAVNWFVTNTAFDNFDGGPATSFNNFTGDGLNYIYASNKNGFIYAFDNNGAILWSTNELTTTTSVPLSLTSINVYNNAGILGAIAAPVVMVATDDGNFYGLFAAQATTNIYGATGSRLAYGYAAAGSQIKAPMAAAQNTLVGTDDQGFVYGLGNFPSIGGTGGYAPGSPISPPNDPANQANFGHITSRYLTPAAYNALRQTAIPDYGTFTAPANFRAAGNAFDFGETIYVLVYNYAYNPGGTGNPPSINFNISIGGTSLRSVTVPTEQFAGAPANEDGFAILSFPIQAAGQSALTPGNGAMNFKVSILGKTGQSTQYFIDPSLSQLMFSLANPIGIAVVPPSGTSFDNANGYGFASSSLGADLASYAFPNNNQNLFNGAQSTVVPWALTLGQSLGYVSDGNSGKGTIGVYDRSLLALLNGPDIGGLTNIRVERNTLAWQNGYNGVINPIGGANGMYPGIAVLDSYENYPVNFPNDSLDYPDIAADQIAVTKEPNGKTENPTFNGVTLEVPGNLFTKDVNGNYTNTTAITDYTLRTPVPTPFEFDLDVPKFQPANASTTGYQARINVFADSNNNGVLDTSGGKEEAFRSFLFGTGVDLNQKLSVITPSVDLGTLAGGTGIIPGPGINPTTVYSPWLTTGVGSIYKSFQALNEGNVNLRNVRVANSETVDNLTFTPWPFYSLANDSLGYIDGSVSMYSDLDPAFSPSALGGILPGGEVFSVKPRVTDGSGTRILSNPVSRITNLKLNPNLPAQDPQITITPPIGFPTGTYSDIVRLIEDDSKNRSLNLNTGIYSDPTLNLSFTVGETRLTNSNTSNVAPMADDLLPVGWNGAPADANVQPSATRDLFGNLDAAWSSNRTSTVSGLLGTTTNSAYRIYGATLLGSTPQPATPGLADFAGFNSPTNAKWLQTTAPYPFGATSGNAALANNLFGAAPGEHVLGANAGEEDSVTFGHPSFPSTGQVDPFNSTNSFASELMAFTGTALVQTATGQEGVNAILMSTVTPGNGVLAAYSAPVSLPFATSQPIGKPSVVQVSANQGIVFYSEANSGKSGLFYSLFSNNQFQNPVPVSVGDGFDGAIDPSAVARPYFGADAATIASSNKLIDLTFSGKLRGRKNNEIFLTRMPTDGLGAPAPSNGSATQLSYFAPITGEVSVRDGSSTTFRVRGVNWNPTAALVLTLPTGAVNVAANGIYTPSTGVWSVQTPLGLVYLDSTVGTIRFARIAPTQGQVPLLSYQPMILRVSDNNDSALTSTSIMWDNKLVGSPNIDTAGNLHDRGWFAAGGGVANLANNNLRNDRYVFTYDSGAVGGIQTRPMVKTMRIGVDLSQYGMPLPSQVASVGPFQMDPVNNEIYFTTQDEGSPVTITYASGAITLIPTLVNERSQAVVPIDNPAASSQMASFLDPFDPLASSSFLSRRPELIWMFWTSTRQGTSDVFFESYSPALYTVAGSK